MSKITEIKAREKKINIIIKQINNYKKKKSI